MLVAPRTASTRDRLLTAAAHLFYREGITATGVEKLCAAAGVSKRSMYQLFATKEDLVAASLAHAGPETHQLFLPDAAADLAPRERILHVFEVLESLAGTTGFVGCRFVNAATELRDPSHPASAVARDFKQRLTDWFAAQARAAGAADPDLLAQQLTIVFDGSAARAVMFGKGLDGVAVTTAAALVDAALA